MSTKSTIFLTNDKNEHCFFDSSSQFKNENGEIKDELTIEFDKSNISIDRNDPENLIITIINVNSDLYKIFSNITDSVEEQFK
jgi:hypothetical protein